MTTTVGQELVPHQPPSIPALRAADQGVAASLESVLSDNTHRVYGTQWRIFTGWCDEVGLVSLPAEPLTVARYLATRANSGASIATLRLATSAISKAYEWAKLESPCRDPGVRASLKGWGRRLSKPQRQSGALTADVLAVIRLTAVQPRKRGRGIEMAEQAAERGKFDVALVAVLSDAGLRRSEAASLTWGDVQRWDDGSGRITVVRSKTDVEAQGAVVAITWRCRQGEPFQLGLQVVDLLAELIVVASQRAKSILGRRRGIVQATDTEALAPRGEGTVYNCRSPRVKHGAGSAQL